MMEIKEFIKTIKEELPDFLKTEEVRPYYDILKKKQASYFSCVVFLSIVVIHLADENCYFFFFYRGGIESITKGGPRAMVDLAELVLKYYYHPLMKGSYSIKVVLPSVLNSSEYIKSRYSKAIY